MKVFFFVIKRWFLGWRFRLFFLWAIQQGEIACQAKKKSEEEGIIQVWQESVGYMGWTSSQVSCKFLHTYDIFGYGEWIAFHLYLPAGNKPFVVYLIGDKCLFEDVMLCSSSTVRHHYTSCTVEYPCMAQRTPRSYIYFTIYTILLRHSHSHS